jgi:hypothetical protein
MSAPEMPAANVDAYREKFVAEELAVKSASGYDSNSGLHGLVVSFASSDGRTYNLLAARGGQVSNDHYPYYEALFDDQGNLLRSQMFYFDVAGMEGADGWPSLFVVAVLIWLVLILLGIVATLGYLAVRGIWQSIRSRRKSIDPRHT